MYPPSQEQAHPRAHQHRLLIDIPVVELSYLAAHDPIHPDQVVIACLQDALAAGPQMPLAGTQLVPSELCGTHLAAACSFLGNSAVGIPVGCLAVPRSLPAV